MTTDVREVFARRLAYYIQRGERGVFARKVGIDKARVSRLVNATAINAQLATVVKYAKALGLEPEDLLTEPVELPIIREVTTPYGQEEFAYIPRLPITLAAGAPRLDIDSEPAGTYVFREDFFGPRGLDPDQCRVAPLAKDHHGESMRETIQPGAMVLLDCRPVTTVVKDALYVVRAPDDEGVTVKRCAIRDEQLLCKPDNPQHQPFAIALRGRELPKIILARVVWWANEAP